MIQTFFAVALVLAAPVVAEPVDLVEGILGLTAVEPGWGTVRFAPRVPDTLDSIQVTVPTPRGDITVHYEKGSGFEIDAPEGVSVHAEVPVTIRNDRELGDAAKSVLESAGWTGRVGDGLGVWVSVAEQKLRLVQSGRVVWQVPCATSSKGVGSEMDSEKTPLGWHSVALKVGEGAPWGQVFRVRRATEEVWKPGQETDEDLVLTRVLVLTGEEEGKNKGGNVDSRARNIYIHGTNAEEKVGTPSSHGCVRLKNDDVIGAFERIPVGTPVLITD